MIHYTWSRGARSATQIFWVRRISSQWCLCDGKNHREEDNWNLSLVSGQSWSFKESWWWWLITKANIDSSTWYSSEHHLHCRGKYQLQLKAAVITIKPINTQALLKEKPPIFDSPDHSAVAALASWSVPLSSWAASLQWQLENWTNFPSNAQGAIYSPGTLP